MRRQGRSGEEEEDGGERERRERQYAGANELRQKLPMGTNRWEVKRQVAREDPGQEVMLGLGSRPDDSLSAEVPERTSRQ